MKKLKSKVFWIITLMLTVFLLSVLVVFNFQNYNREKNNIKDSLYRMSDDLNPKEPFQEKSEKVDLEGKSELEEKNVFVGEDSIPQKIFMDTEVYTIKYDDEKNIKDVISHTGDDSSTKKIEEKAKDILNLDTKNDSSVILLYFNEYYYSFSNNNTLVIVDNTKTKDALLKELLISVLIFVIVELAIIFISNKLTEWITKPAFEALEKQKRFISDASHELKTPVAVILANAEVLENDFQIKWINNIKNETERVNKLITSLLDLSKMENLKNKEIYPINDLSKIIQNTGLTFEGLMYDKNIDFKLEVR